MSELWKYNDFLFFFHLIFPRFFVVLFFITYNLIKEYFKLKNWKPKTRLFYKHKLATVY